VVDFRIGRCTPLLLSLLFTGAAMAETNWTSSAITPLPRPIYSVLGAAPACSGEVRIAAEVERVFDAFGRIGISAETLNRTSRTVGDALNLLGFSTVRQDYAVCADVCALVPLDATRITHVVAYVDNGPGTPFRTVPFGLWSDYVHWEGSIDTTHTDANGRYACARVRHWMTVERRVFLVVGYER
jgi:hypothetical protein